MAINRYFENFPTITYSNTQAIDITKRVAVLDSVSGNPYVFYPYDIGDFERPDQFSARYYDDAYKSWILYLTNKMVDPYHEWYMQQPELTEFCEKKYGSLYTAQQKIKHYQNDYVNETRMSVDSFVSLPQEIKKYWVPVYGLNNTVVEYERRKAEWTTGTNKIVSYTVSNSNNFIKDEICDIVYQTGVTGKGQILYTSNNIIYIQHVSGQYFIDATADAIITANSYIYGNESESNIHFTAFNFVANNIPVFEESYWRPVTYFEYEYEKNEYYKTITVLDSQLSKTISDNLRDLLRE